MLCILKTEKAPALSDAEASSRIVRAGGAVKSAPNIAGPGSPVNPPSQPKIAPGTLSYTFRSAKDYGYGDTLVTISTGLGEAAARRLAMRELWDDPAKGHWCQNVGNGLDLISVKNELED
jgi:hypothetical protein